MGAEGTREGWQVGVMTASWVPPGEPFCHSRTQARGSLWMTITQETQKVPYTPRIKKRTKKVIRQSLNTPKLFKISAFCREQVQPTIFFFQFCLFERCVLKRPSPLCLALSHATELS